MAQAVKELFPAPSSVSARRSKKDSITISMLPSRLPTKTSLCIEKRMQQIIAGKHRFQREEISRDEAIRRAKQEGENYRLEIIDGLEGEATISYYHHDTFSDLCRGPHLPSTDKIKAYKLLSVAGAYWRGDEHNKMLQRIYGISFPKKSMLDEYLIRLEQAKKRDHRKLGKELGLFTFTEETGGGLPLWLPKGALMRHIIENYWKDMHLSSWLSTGDVAAYRPSQALGDFRTYRSLCREHVFAD